MGVFVLSKKLITMEFNRTQETIEMNNQLQIVKINNFQFRHPLGTVSCKGWAVCIPGKGFLKFKSDNNFLPYVPIGGKKALQSIIADGGFIDYNDLEFINPVVR